MQNIAYLTLAYMILQEYVQDLAENLKAVLIAFYDLHSVITLLQEPDEAVRQRLLPEVAPMQGAIRYRSCDLHPSQQGKAAVPRSVDCDCGGRAGGAGWCFGQAARQR